MCAPSKMAHIYRHIRASLDPPVPNNPTLRLLDSGCATAKQATFKQQVRPPLLPSQQQLNGVAALLLYRAARAAAVRCLLPLARGSILQHSSRCHPLGGLPAALRLADSICCRALGARSLPLTIPCRPSLFATVVNKAAQALPNAGASVHCLL